MYEGFARVISDINFC